ncbi:aldose 1-epimerase family protein [Rothia sp. P6271]|uniref:aldose 1-epimerase family protein n=1 Tax=Rothia sp. P6271 TaxID=3402659 RepID=UPI003ACF5F22
MSASFSGTTYTLNAGGYSATIAEVGANLESLISPQGKQLILPASPNELRAGACGSHLAPWPNRIDGGRYTFSEVEHQLPISEVERHNAIHGLVMWQRWSFEEPVINSHQAQLSGALELPPCPGYPFFLKYTVTYTLNDEGLQVEFSAQNVGDEPAPYAYAAHPYLSAGGDVDQTSALNQWVLEIPAESYLETDERLLPVAEHSVEGTSLDFRAGALLGKMELDHTFGSLSYADKRGHVRLYADVHRSSGVELTFDESIRWVQVYTDGSERRALAVEPMTAPANAFNSGTHLVVLSPGEEHISRWGIRAFDQA